MSSPRIADALSDQMAQLRAENEVLKIALRKLVWAHTEGEGTENPHDDSLWHDAYLVLPEQSYRVMGEPTA